MQDQVRHDGFGTFYGFVNVEGPTSNNEFYQLKKRLNKANLPAETCLPLADYRVRLL